MHFAVVANLPSPRLSSAAAVPFSSVPSCSRALAVAGTDGALLSVLFLPLLSITTLLAVGLSFVFSSSFLSIYFLLVPMYCCPIGRIRELKISGSMYYLLLLPISVAVLLLNGSLSTLLLVDKSQGVPGGRVEKGSSTANYDDGFY